MRFAMCNEFCTDWQMEDVFKLAAETGYQGVEIAPFTIEAAAGDISPEQRSNIRQLALEYGLDVVGLHWLLVSPPDMYVNHPDDEIRNKTHRYFIDLINLCGDLGGTRMTIGSPKQRDVLRDQGYRDTWVRTVEFYRCLAPIAQEREVILCIEPLPADATNFLNTKDDAVRLIHDVDHSHFKLILDCLAMIDEGRPIPEIIKEAAPYLEHFHAHDDTMSYPGTGSLDFKEILAALTDIQYDGWVSIEVFDFMPGPTRIAGDGLAHLKQCLPV